MEIIQKSQLTPITAPDNAIALEWISHRNSRAQTHSLAEITVPPGVTVKTHYHKLTEEVYFITQGKGIMYLEGERHEVVPGDAIVILPGERHGIENATGEPLEMIVTCVPSWEAEDQYFDV